MDTVLQRRLHKMVGFAAQRLMELETEPLCGAAHGERYAERLNQRKGHQARADVFDYIARFYNPRRRHSTIGYLSPMNFEAWAEAG